MTPYDIDRLLDSLRRAAPTAPPTFDNLLGQFDSYQLPDVSLLHAEDAGWRATRDSVQALADSLNAIGQEASGYAREYARLGELYRRYTQRTAEREARLRDQMGAHRELALMARTAADSIRAWEEDAFRDYPALAASALEREGRQAHEAVTGADGIARVTLEPGPWWVTARMRHPDNPYLEYYWTIALVAGPLGPRRVPLSLEMAETRWRH